MMRDAKWYRESVGPRCEHGYYGKFETPRNKHGVDGRLFRKSIWRFIKRNRRRQFRQQLRQSIYPSFPGRII